MEPLPEYKLEPGNVLYVSYYLLLFKYGGFMFDMRYSCTFQNYYMKLMFLNHDILPELIMFIISFQEHFIERRRCYMPITDRDTGLYTVLVQM